jgi:hypothetical protein
MLPHRVTSSPSESLSRPTSSIGSPDRIVVLRHSGSVRDEETTYFCTWSRYAPAGSSVCCGQWPRKSSNVCRPTNTASVDAPKRSTPSSHS